MQSISKSVVHGWELSNTQMEPTRRLSRVIMSLQRAAHLQRWVLETRKGSMNLRLPIFEKPHIEDLMLELRPICEHCNKALPPDSLEARICSYECTFCASCVERALGNVCPNCGGGFVPRPIRPSTNWNDDNFLGTDPASTKVKHRLVESAAHARFSAKIKTILPEKR